MSEKKDAVFSIKILSESIKMASYNTCIYTHMFACDAHIRTAYNHKTYGKVQSLVLENIKLPRLHFDKGLCIYVGVF